MARTLEYVLAASYLSLTVAFVVLFCSDKNKDERIFRAALSPNCDFAVCSGPSGVLVYDIPKGRITRLIPGGAASGPTDISNNSELVAIGNRRSQITLIEPATGEVTRTFAEQEERIRAVRFSPDSRHIACAGESGYLSIWNIDEEKKVRLIRACSGEINSLAYSRDGTLIATGGCDRETRSSEINIWNSTTGENLASIPDLEYAFISDLSFSHDSLNLSALFSISRVKTWDISDPAAPRLFGYCTVDKCSRNTAEIKPLDKVGAPHNDGGCDIARIAYLEGSRDLLACGYGPICILSLDQEKPKLSIRARAVEDARLVDNGRTVCTIGSDETIRWWDVQTGTEKSRISGVTFRRDAEWIPLLAGAAIWLVLLAAYWFAGEKGTGPFEQTLLASRIVLSYSAIVSLGVGFALYQGLYPYGPWNDIGAYSKILLVSLASLGATALEAISAKARTVRHHPAAVVSSVLSTLVLTAMAFLLLIGTVAGV